MLPRLSIVIPIERCATAWRDVLQDLQALPVDVELILIAAEEAPSDLDAHAGALAGRLRWLQAAPGCAARQNRAVDAARGDWLCFLRADARLDGAALRALASLRDRVPAVYYFDLGYVDGPALMRLNALGIYLRSRLFGLPFGDQGLALPRALFEQVGRFDESLSGAEGDALIRAARRADVAVRPIGASLRVSGRQHADGGWWRTTLHGLTRSWSLAQVKKREPR